jgi:phosphatidylglycerophosphate synthase
MRKSENPTGYQSERRPIASRENNISKWAANLLAERGVSPNSISLAGMVAGVLAGGAFAATQFVPDFWRLAFFAAAVLIQLRLLANMMDGMVAVQTKRASAVGELFNEIPDRVSDAFTIIGAGYAAGSSPELGFVAACLAIFLAYLRAQGKVAGAHQEYCGPLAKPQRMFVLTTLAIVSTFAPTAWTDFATPVAGWGVVAWGLVFLITGEIVTAIRRLVRISVALKEAV